MINFAIRNCIPFLQMQHKIKETIHGMYASSLWPHMQHERTGTHASHMHIEMEARKQDRDKEVPIKLALLFVASTCNTFLWLHGE